MGNRRRESSISKKITPTSQAKRLIRIIGADGQQFQDVEVERMLKIRGVEMALHRGWNGKGWSVSELKTGASASCGRHATPERAIEAAMMYSVLAIKSHGTIKAAIAYGLKQMKLRGIARGGLL